MATANKITTLQVVCPRCMNEDETVTLNLNDLSECRCGGCDATFSADEAVAEFVAMAERWEAVAKWVKEAPVV